MTAGMKRVSVSDLQRMHRKGQPITMITAYDYPTARLADEAGIPVILVGDSLGMVVLGYDSTLPVTVEDMIHHGSAVMRGAERAHVVVDMPFGSYQAGWKSAMRNASRIMQETSCSAVKLEGGQRSAEIVKRLVDAGIPVMGHVGLTPQSVNAMGGYKIQGRTPRDAVRVLSDAKALEEAGAYAVVLEVVPAAVAWRITERLNVPTIGIGAGPYCSGQVQVMHDMLGLYPDIEPQARTPLPRRRGTRARRTQRVPRGRRGRELPHRRRSRSSSTPPGASTSKRRSPATHTTAHAPPTVRTHPTACTRTSVRTRASTPKMAMLQEDEVV